MMKLWYYLIVLLGLMIVFLNVVSELEKKVSSEFL